MSRCVVEATEQGHLIAMAALKETRLWVVGLSGEAELG